ncbi:MAG: ankyrin repeat domain-containing protein [Alphaproteobacteria bacterium]|nr:ankyrin repeat domain-containing protein [Alphaproteobacteria bacterium]
MNTPRPAINTVHAGRVLLGELAKKFCDKEYCRDLIAAGADLELQGSFHGRRALGTAIHHGHEDLAICMLKKGAQANIKDSFGETPLICAATKNKVTIITALIKHGADINACNSTGRTALMEAATHGMDAAAAVLLHHGADTKAQDFRGQQAWHHAVRAGHTDIAALIRTTEKLRITQDFQKAAARGTIRDRKVLRPKPQGQKPS